jgi:ATP-dependent DNA helicase HFM1/MER3
VRAKRNPSYYKLDRNTNRSNIDELLQKICTRDISALQELELVTSIVPLRSTEFGDAMARYYVQFETMKIILGLPEAPKCSDLVS